MKKSLLQLALVIAEEKLSQHTENFLHYTFIVQKNKIVEWAKNGPGTPPIHWGYHQRMHDNRYVPKYHSEVRAYAKAKGILDKRKRFEVINVRLNRQGDIRLSKPCSCCYAILKEMGCSRFYFSSETGFLRIA